MNAKLIAEEGALKGLVLSLEEGETWVIGRDPDQSQLIVEDPLTSRKHAIARRTSEGFTLENLSTTNPIQINEENVTDQPRLLQQGDTVKIGGEVFRFYTDLSTYVLNNNDVPQAHETNGQTNPMPDNNIALEELPKENLPPEPAIPSVINQNSEEDSDDHDTIFDAEESKPSLAEINFGMTEVGRWLLKVINGPNNGAEFYMQTGHGYVVGTDPHSCDIVFHDTSVSRQHARITIGDDDVITIEDLKSRNGILVSGQLVKDKEKLSPSVIVTLGTTSFVVYDREGEMQTIISPLLPSIVKVLQEEEKKEESKDLASKDAEIPAAPVIAEKPRKDWGSFIMVAVLMAVLGLVGLGTISLFRSEPVVMVAPEDPTKPIEKAIAPFPAVKFSFNKSTGGLLLIGHVSTAGDKNELMYNLQGIKSVKTTDDSGIIIDEYVWQEINSVLSKNPAWKGISVHSPSPGQFILTGYLETRKQAEQLSDYISVNFPYIDLLKRQVLVEEDVISQINTWLLDHGLRYVTPKMSNGEIMLTGTASTDKEGDINQVVSQIQQIPGVRAVRNMVVTKEAELGTINITNQYDVSGQSKVGDKYTVIINGRFISEGDTLDGMRVKSIKSNMILLEKGGTQYRIDYNK